MAAGAPVMIPMHSPTSKPTTPEHPRSQSLGRSRENKAVSPASDRQEGRPPDKFTGSLQPGPLRPATRAAGRPGLPEPAFRQ
jgi:hypothetical protein